MAGGGPAGPPRPCTGESPPAAQPRTQESCRHPAPGPPPAGGTGSPGALGRAARVRTGATGGAARAGPGPVSVPGLRQAHPGPAPLSTGSAHRHPQPIRARAAPSAQAQLLPAAILEKGAVPRGALREGHGRAEPGLARQLCACAEGVFPRGRKWEVIGLWVGGWGHGWVRPGCVGVAWPGAGAGDGDGNGEREGTGPRPGVGPGAEAAAAAGARARAGPGSGSGSRPQPSPPGSRC